MSTSPGAASSAITLADLSHRLHQLSVFAAAAGADVVVVSPSADLRYLVGSSVASHERLTALVVPADGPPQLLMPALERGSWNGMPLENLDVPLTLWSDGQSPYRVFEQLLSDVSGSDARVIAVDNHMPAVHALGLSQAVVGSELTLAGPVISDLRMRKSAAEISALSEAGVAIDAVHRRMGEWLRPGRTESAVAADIAAALVEEGHEHADFVIVASGPNGASPHHSAGGRTIEAGELVVVDIGGPLPSGYYSDCTRTYVTGKTAPSARARDVYDVVQRAQAAAVAAVRPGIPAEQIDAVARGIIDEAGFGDYFITRTGHGIGLEVHEEPYIVAGNELPLEPGMAFSVEPGIYLPGEFGVRIEDIVVVTDDGVERCNNAPTELVILD